MSITEPAGWDLIAKAGSTDDKTFAPDALPPREKALAILDAYLEAMKFRNCRVNGDYLKSLGLGGAVIATTIRSIPAPDRSGVNSEAGTQFFAPAPGFQLARG